MGESVPCAEVVGAVGAWGAGAIRRLSGRAACGLSEGGRPRSAHRLRNRRPRRNVRAGRPPLALPGREFAALLRRGRRAPPDPYATLTASPVHMP
ncbi:hypothetical protein T261_7457 [Streptomyces lydicus]|nr:hypothetical protein T261_7457 [Streptomyces lydicus]